MQRSTAVWPALFPALLSSHADGWLCMWQWVPHQELAQQSSLAPGPFLFCRLRSTETSKMLAGSRDSSSCQPALGEGAGVPAAGLPALVLSVHGCLISHFVTEN